MRRTITAAVAAALGIGLVGAPALAADLSEQAPITVDVQLGNGSGDKLFEPNYLAFETGKLYKMVLHNRSPTKHYFSALRFASAVWTRKVEIGNVEIKGDVREIEVKPGGEVEWFFVPVKAGEYSLECTVPNHAEAGMVGTIEIE